MVERIAELAEANERLRRQIAERIRAEKERDLLLAEVRQLTETVQRREAELRGIIDNMADGVFVCDITGILTLVNRRGLEMVGLNEPTDLKHGRSEIAQLIELRHPNGSPLVYCEMALARALKGEVVTDYDVLAVTLHSRKNLYFRTNAAPISDQSGEIIGAVAVIRDVTELRELDHLKDQFIEVAAHELKTPVAIMKGYAQALLRSPGEFSNHRHILEAIDRGADRIDTIVKDLLDISRLKLGHQDLVPVSIDLNSLIVEVIDRMAMTTAKHSIKLVASEPVVIRGDRDRIEQVLINLIDNAIRYSPEGGTIELALQVKNREAIVSVEDHGVGIPHANQSSISNSSTAPILGPLTTMVAWAWGCSFLKKSSAGMLAEWVSRVQKGREASSILAFLWPKSVIERGARRFYRIMELSGDG